jgi:SAM-dependent methyltransferase
MIRAHAQSLVSTDYRRPARSGSTIDDDTIDDDTIDDDTIDVRQLAAEDVATAFAPGEFDLVFSSNLLEHVPDPQAVLEGIGVVLADDGITVNVMPNRVWKACQLILYVPNLVVTAFDDALAARSPRAVLDRLGRAHPGTGGGHASSEKNNPTVVRPERSLARRLLLPTPHGVSDTHGREFAAFSRRRWEAELRRAGFDLVAVLTGPLSSGYGFGLDTARRVLERVGVGSEYVYVAKKAGKASRHGHAFSSASSRARRVSRHPPRRAARTR